MKSLSGTDFYTFFRPSKCANRVFLKHSGVPEAPASPFNEILLSLGNRHEQRHLGSFPEFVDLREGDLAERSNKTLEEIGKKSKVLYQAVLRSTYESAGNKIDVVGEPDFLILEGDGYIIRDSKITRRVTERDHPEILRQLELYGWLYEQNVGRPPNLLEVHAGTGDIVKIPYDGGATAIAILKEIFDLKSLSSEPYSPVGWSKCGGCPFHGHCWPRAESERDVALVAGVDQGLANALHEQDVETIENLFERFDESSLAEFKRPWGQRMQRVGKKAGSIIQMARALSTGEEYLIQAPDLPEHRNYVMFDLEGLPPQLDELEKIYLWGIQVFGDNKGDFLPAVAGFGEEGDKEGWESFLHNSAAVLDRHGDIPFVHWHHYERVKIDLYRDRYGDRDGIAERVRSNLVDLLPITQRCVALPLPSYSLKVVEKYVGFKRTLEDVAGDWAMAMYIEAMETEDQEKRNELMDQILAYNREDLEATWAVLQWLKSKI
jgi:predicted RecB family nuclease